MIRAGTRMPSLYVAGNSQTVSEILFRLSIIAIPTENRFSCWVSLYIPQSEISWVARMRKQTNASTNAHLLRITFVLLSLLAAGVISFALAQRNSADQSRQFQTVLPSQKTTLTLAERIGYQRAIEKVYWRHRIWPKENASTKPNLDEVMSAAQIEGKVEEYLRKSQALEDYWQRPITSD